MVRLRQRADAAGDGGERMRPGPGLAAWLALLTLASRFATGLAEPVSEGNSTARGHQELPAA
jgi:hypothetical protein